MSDISKKKRLVIDIAEKIHHSSGPKLVEIGNMYFEGLLHKTQVRDVGSAI